MKSISLKLFYLFISIFSLNVLADEPKFEIDFETGYRQDSFKWNFAGYQNNPNILSELKWEELKGQEVGSHIKMFKNGAYMRVSGNYSYVYSGKVRDSDYLEDNRKNEFSRSKANARDSYFYGFSIASGFELPIYKNKLSLFPLFGYSWNLQCLKMKQGFVIIDEIFDSYGKFDGLNSSYSSNFRGPFVGTDLNYQISSYMTLLATLEYHFIKYRGKANWNLRDDFFKDAEHTANGHGIFASIGTCYQLDDKWSFGLSLNGRFFEAKNGNARTYVSVETETEEIIKFKVDHPFNRVTWKTFSALLHLKYAF